ncbi:PEP-CTERM sorting domain-containing protein, partial [Akkermansiaceae bacterium]|nr:PEP-CTERM sorting domain-containing protein [Akkermansiaceae bacterium]
FTTNGSGAIASIGGFTAVSASTVDLSTVLNNGTLNWTFGGADAFDAATSHIFVMSTSPNEVTIADTSSMIGTNFALDLGNPYGGGDAVRGNAALDSGWDQHFQANFDTVAVPEPASSTLLGLAGLALVLRRRK